MKRIKLIAFIMIATTVLYGAGLVATVASYPVKVNGETLSATVLNQNGTTYLPLKAVGQALGADINWTGKSVEINTLDVDKLKQACVMIIASDGETYSQGSGVYIDYDQVLTAYHVVDGGRDKVRTAVDKADPNTMTVISSAPDIDAAILKPTIEKKPVKIGDSDEVKVGDKVILISSPSGKANTISNGVVKNITNEFVVTAVSDGGSSGGALFSMDGSLIGILFEGDVGLKECYVRPINDIRKAL